MSSTLVKPICVAAILAVGVASAVTLLYVSVEREFVPGIVELSAALVVGALVGAGFMFVSTNRRRVAGMIARADLRALLFAGAGAAVLALTAVLTYFYESYPWPASLLGAVVLAYAATLQPRGRAGSS